MRSIVGADYWVWARGALLHLDPDCLRLPPALPQKKTKAPVVPA
jgi:hypothetical protein